MYAFLRRRSTWLCYVPILRVELHFSLKDFSRYGQARLLIRLELTIEHMQDLLIRRAAVSFAYIEQIFEEGEVIRAEVN